MGGADVVGVANVVGVAERVDVADAVGVSYRWLAVRCSSSTTAATWRTSGWSTSRRCCHWTSVNSWRTGRHGDWVTTRTATWAASTTSYRYWPDGSSAVATANRARPLRLACWLSCRLMATESCIMTWICLLWKSSFWIQPTGVRSKDNDSVPLYYKFKARPIQVTTHLAVCARRLRTRLVALTARVCCAPGAGRPRAV